MSGFQTRVNYSLPANYPGRKASQNPFRSCVSPLGQMAYRAGQAGAIIASFVWADQYFETVSSVAPDENTQPLGFLYATGQGLMTSFLEGATMKVPPGLGIDIAEGGDFFAVSKSDALRGHAVYASLTDGSITTDYTGKTIAGFIETSWVVSVGSSAGKLCIITGPAFPHKLSAPTTTETTPTTTETTPTTTETTPTTTETTPTTTETTPTTTPENGEKA